MRGSDPELARVVRNLLSNAIRHTRPTAPSSSPGRPGTGPGCASTTGCGGIPTDDLDRVYDVAFRREGARTPDDESRGGLGRASRTGLVETQHGEIHAGNHGPGYRVQVRLPLTVPLTGP